MNLVTLILDLLFPKSCVGCNNPGSYLCPTCQKKITYFTFPLCPACGRPIYALGVHPSCIKRTSLDGLIALGKHDGPLQNLIKHIKYYGHFDMVDTATSLLLPHIPEAIRKNMLITSVPMHPQRERERGYNQSELLAKTVAKQLHLPYIPLLKKVKQTRPQAGLKREERLKNLAHSFAVTSEYFHFPTVLLVDDVTTTRTTLNECAFALKRAGVKKAYGVVLAHGK